MRLSHPSRVISRMCTERAPSLPRVVLVVEDEWLLRWALSQKLAESGFHVLEAGSAEEAFGHILREDFATRRDE